MKKVAILGAGESGVGAAILAKKKGMDVFVSDGSKIADKYKKELFDYEIAFEEEKHSMETLKEADILIKSPGIPDSIRLIKELISFGLDPISEIEYAYQFCDAKIIAITGSNGKTTTTGLIYHLIEGSGMTVKVGGNYGVSFARLLAEDDIPEVFVLEVSSFQLDGIRNFRPEVAIVLNITPDHLDRYDYDLEKYAASKMRIGMNQVLGDFLIINSNEWERVETLETEAELSVVSAELVQEGILDLELLNEYEFENTGLAGKHNRFNAQCAVFAAEWIGVDANYIEKRLSDFDNLPHRMEFVKEVKGVRFINDSKATNVDAVQFAIDSIVGEVIWIAGGTDKGNDYNILKPLVKIKVKALVCLGVDNKALRLGFEGLVPTIIETQDIEEAVLEAFRLAEGHATVLLSPACASFDLFANYIDRGDQYKKAVNQL